MRSFLSHPSLSLQHLRTLSDGELRRRQSRMALHARDVLYDAPGSRVGSNFLREVALRCLVPPQRAEHESMNRTATRRRYEGNSWARKCGAQQNLTSSAAAKAAAGVANSVLNRAW